MKQTGYNTIQQSLLFTFSTVSLLGVLSSATSCEVSLGEGSAVSLVSGSVTGLFSFDLVVSFSSVPCFISSSTFCASFSSTFFTSSSSFFTSSSPFFTSSSSFFTSSAQVSCTTGLYPSPSVHGQTARRVDSAWCTSSVGMAVRSISSCRTTGETSPQFFIHSWFYSSTHTSIFTRISSREIRFVGSFSKKCFSKSVS